ncbi:MAG: ribosome-associated translation inhibitor RaiA [Deltaproteobacteria bacterium]|nr:ribosome-associated translation inhibitor RaiA [Deltaproteobacteria bacterium]
MIEPTFTFRNIEATDGLRAHTLHKLEKIRKYLVKPITAHIILSIEHLQHCAEITFVDSGIQYVGHAKSPDMYASIDQALDKLTRQLQKHKERVKEHKKARPIPTPAAPDAMD